MLNAIDLVLRAQGFKSRIDQYFFQGEVPNKEISERWLAKHKITGTTYLIKTAPRDPFNDPVRELAMNELKVLQSCN